MTASRWWERLIGRASEPVLDDPLGWDAFLAQARRLERPCDLLVEAGEGDTIAAYWYGVRAGARCIALQQDGAWIEVFLDADCEHGRVATLSSPDRTGVPLRREPGSSLPSPDALFLNGGPVIADYLARHGWSRDDSYTDNFPDALARRYNELWMDTHPFLASDSGLVAVSGGWSWTWPDSESSDFLNTELVLLTIRDSEPWVEVLKGPNGYRVLQRVS